MSKLPLLRLILPVVIFVLLLGVTNAQEGPTLEATVIPSELEVGQRGHLVVTPPEDVDLKSLKVSFSGLRIGAFEKQPDGTFVADLYPLKPGTYGLEEMQVEVVIPSGDQTSASLAPFAFTIPDPEPIDAPPDDYTGLFAADRTMWRYYVAYTLAGIALLALLAALFVLVRRWMRRRAVVAQAEPALPEPIDEAFQSLSLLESLDEFHTKGTKAHYVMLSMLLRRYIERQWNRPAVEMSEDEVIGMLRGEFSHRAGVSDLLRLLNTASLAKFARLEVGIDDVQAHLRAARAFLTSERDRLRAAAMAQQVSQRASRRSEAA
jgi:hypothetical protein